MPVGDPTPDWEAKAEFLFAQGLPFYHTSANDAIALPTETALQRLEWLKARGCPRDQPSIDHVLMASNPDVLQWMLAGGAEGFDRWDYRELGSVASPDVIQILVKSGQIEPEQVMASCIQAGAKALPAVLWMAETYGPKVLDPAADCGTQEFNTWWYDDASGSAAVMSLLVKHHGMVLMQDTFTSAAASDQPEEALEWLVQMGCPVPANGAPYFRAIYNEDSRASLRALRALRRLGVPWDTAPHTLSTAVQAGLDILTLRWMVAEGCPVNWAKAQHAAAKRLQGGDLLAEEMLAWAEAEAAEAAAQAPPLQGTQAPKGPPPPPGAKRKRGGE